MTCFIDNCRTGMSSTTALNNSKPNVGTGGSYDASCGHGLAPISE